MPPDSSQPLNADSTSSWIDHIRGIHVLGETILASGWQPSAILGIARGGLIPAAILSYQFDVKCIQSVRVQHYDDHNKTLDSGPQFVDGPQPDATLNIDTERLLIVDDIIDTGETLKLVRSAVPDHAQEVKVAALYVRSNQKLAADWYWTVEDEWVVFPWAPEN